uniref:Centrosomal protein of 76 kDa n=1 Tax=Scophthalmus maximus TaxID=52904 RepID=A0A8D3AFD9_SCOMX
MNKPQHDIIHHHLLQVNKLQHDIIHHHLLQVNKPQHDIIQHHLLQMDIHGKIREVLAETVRDDRGRSRRPPSEADFLRALQCRGIVDDVMKNLHLTQVDRSLHQWADTGSPPKPAAHHVDKDVTQLKKSNIDLSRRCLYLQVLGGKAFLEHLQEPEPLPGQVCSTFTLYLHFCNQRFRSKPVPCACEPNLEEGFLLELHRDGTEGSKMADATALLSMCDPVHLVLIKTDTSSETTLVSSHFLDWRTVLGSPSGKTCFAVELMGVGSECKVPAGVLTVSLELHPPPLAETLSPDIISTQQLLERQRTAEKERLFLVYAKRWWREFLEIRPSHQSKMVKIFAQDENGINRPVCCYVRVLRAGRLLESPRQAARFVSLLAHEKAPVVGGGGKQEQWCTLMAFVCRGKGDCEDHATLLCSLLLGFGLDAYVCVGTKAKGVPHTWVLTRGTDGSVTFWESLTAHRYLHKTIDPDAPPLPLQPKPSSPYRTVGCVFNHQTFLANCQPSDAVELCIFDLQNQSRWKAMSEEALKSVCAPGSVTSLPLLPPLCAPSLDPAAASNQMELEMRFLVSEHRKDLELATVWDDHLSYLLSSALSAYELERCTGVSCGNEEFQDAVRRAVPDGHTFKGFPINFLHRSARRAFSTSLKSPFCQEIVSCRGDHVRLAVRVRVFVYPEDACAVWLMFACKYRSVL